MRIVVPFHAWPSCMRSIAASGLGPRPRAAPGTRPPAGRRRCRSAGRAGCRPGSARRSSPWPRRRSPRSRRRCRCRSARRACQAPVLSARNCAAMCRGRAPTARRRPISSVRSSTATSVVFAIPTAPMNRLISARIRNSPARSPFTSLCSFCGLGGGVTTSRLRVGRQFGRGELPCHRLRGAGPGRDDHLGFVLVPDARLRVAVVRQGRLLRDQHRAARWSPRAARSCRRRRPCRRCR